MTAFWDLANDRNDLGFTPWVTARTYFDKMGVDPSLWPIFWDCIGEMDAAYHKHRNRATGSGKGKKPEE